jgi:hypothetical protein
MYCSCPASRQRNILPRVGILNGRNLMFIHIFILKRAVMLCAMLAPVSGAGESLSVPVVDELTMPLP